MIIEKIDSPADMKGLTMEELHILATEVRQGVLNRVMKHGGHVVLTLVLRKQQLLYTMFSMHQTIRLSTTFRIRVIPIRYLQDAKRASSTTTKWIVFRAIHRLWRVQNTIISR